MDLATAVQQEGFQHHSRLLNRRQPIEVVLEAADDSPTERWLLSHAKQSPIWLQITLTGLFVGDPRSEQVSEDVSGSRGSPGVVVTRV